MPARARVCYGPRAMDTVTGTDPDVKLFRVLRDDTAHPEQPDDLRAGRLADLVVAAVAGERVERPVSDRVQHQAHLVTGELDVAAHGAGGLDDGHVVLPRGVGGF